MARYNWKELDYDDVCRILTDYLNGKDNGEFDHFIKKGKLNQVYIDEEHFASLLPLNEFLLLGKEFYNSDTKEKFQLGLEKFLAAGADVTQKDDSGQTAIFNLFFLFFDDLFTLYRFVDIFLEKGVDVNLLDNNSNSLLQKILTECRRNVAKKIDRQMAISWSKRVIDYLLKNSNLDINIKSITGESIMSRGYIERRSPTESSKCPMGQASGIPLEIIEFLKIRGLDINCADKWHFTPLERSIRRNNLFEFLSLCAAGVAVPENIDQDMIDLMIKAAENILSLK